ncbi:MAG: hypothetical protein OXI83_03780 [Gemmatimonadota bacterium]|nr:hypothetical protein [Gemmatimonadota bacterium]
MSTMCYEGYATGSRDCNQQGGAVYHECDAHGAFCAVYYAMDESTDEEAVRMVLAGEMLPGDGGYYFVVNSKETVVMRKCDNSVVARLSSDAAGRLASRKPWRTGASPATIAGA